MKNNQETIKTGVQAEENNIAVQEQTTVNIHKRAIVIYSEEGKNDEVRAWIEKDYGYKNMYIILSFVSKDSGDSNEVRLSRSAIMNNKKALDFIYDWDIDLDSDKTITAICDYIKDKYRELPRLETFGKPCMKDVYNELCKFVHDTKPDPNSIFIKDGYCYIESKRFKRIIQNEFNGVDEKEVKEWLNRKGLLRTQNHGYTCRFKGTFDKVRLTAVAFQDNKEIT